MAKLLGGGHFHDLVQYLGQGFCDCYVKTALKGTIRISTLLERPREKHLPGTMVWLIADLLLENEVQFRGREIPEKDDRRFNQITVTWARTKRTEWI